MSLRTTENLVKIVKHVEQVLSELLSWSYEIRLPIDNDHYSDLCGMCSKMTSLSKDLEALESVKSVIIEYAPPILSMMGRLDDLMNQYSNFRLEEPNNETADEWHRIRLNTELISFALYLKMCEEKAMACLILSSEQNKVNCC